jgi:hypothetical protein
MSRPEFESRLRRSLAVRAATATTSPDAWAAIERRKRRQRRGGLVLALAALAVAVVVAVPLIMVLGGGGEDRMPPAPATRAPATTTPPATTPAPGAGGATTTSGPSSTTVAVRPSSVADPGAAVRAIGQQVAGDPLGAVRFTDAGGDNLVVLSSRTEQRPSQLAIGSEGTWVTLYADHFVTSGGRTRLARKVQDGVQDCTTDHQVEFKSRTPEIFDLDGDGVGEILFGYTVACVGDISPLDLKILVLEGGDKYIMRGETYTSPGLGKEALGRLPVGKPDPAWASWPKGTRALAERRWDAWAIRE